MFVFLLTNVFIASRYVYNGRGVIKRLFIVGVGVGLVLLCRGALHAIVGEEPVHLPTALAEHVGSLIGRLDATQLIK